MLIKKEDTVLVDETSSWKSVTSKREKAIGQESIRLEPKRVEYMWNGLKRPRIDASTEL
jgi:hypothetical protein